MRALTAAEIVRLWETASRYHPVDQALAMLQPAMPDLGHGELAALPLGQRDTLLLSLRRATFGDVLPGVDHCPACGAEVEFELSCSALQTDAGEAGPQSLSVDDYRLTVRPLNSLDLAAAARESTALAARSVLLHRCVTEARQRDGSVAPGQLPEKIADQVSAAALAADPRAEILLDLQCPDCSHRWRNVLDIANVLWLEISARAQRLLMEVHVLASAYGWREAEIFALSPQRRATYLRMAFT